MILGIGIDLISNYRIKEILKKFDKNFKQKIFSKNELMDFEKKFGLENKLSSKAVNFFAKRFASKEACAKALGTGFSRGVFLKDIGVVNGPSGAPTVALTGGAAKRLMALVPNDHDVKIHLTLTDEAPLAMAVVVIEALPRHAPSS